MRLLATAILVALVAPAAAIACHRPSAPRAFKVSEVTHEHALFSWLPPKRGAVASYELLYAGSRETFALEDREWSTYEIECSSTVRARVRAIDAEGQPGPWATLKFRSGACLE